MWICCRLRRGRVCDAVEGDQPGQDPARDGALPITDADACTVAHTIFYLSDYGLRAPDLDRSDLDRVRHVVQSAFDGHRIVIFSGGAAKETAAVLEENRQTAMGGGFGTIMGRNSFQRPHDEALHLLGNVMDIHLAQVPVG